MEPRNKGKSRKRPMRHLSSDSVPREISLSGFTELSNEPLGIAPAQHLEDEIFASNENFEAPLVDNRDTITSAELKVDSAGRGFTRPATMDPAVLAPGEPIVNIQERRLEKRASVGNKILIYKLNNASPAGGFLVDLSANGFLVSAEGLNVKMNDKVVIEVLGDGSLPAGTYQCAIAYVRSFGQFSSSNMKHYGLQVLSASLNAKKNLQHYAA